MAMNYWLLATGYWLLATGYYGGEVVFAVVFLALVIGANTAVFYFI